MILRRSLALMVSGLFLFSSPLWAQNFYEEGDSQVISPQSSEHSQSQLPKWMRDAKPIPMPSLPGNARPRYKRADPGVISPRPGERSQLPKWMRDAKPMPMPSLPGNYRPHYEGSDPGVISPRLGERSQLPKWMRDAKPMPMPTVPWGYGRRPHEEEQNPRWRPMDSDVSESGSLGGRSEQN